MVWQSFWRLTTSVERLTVNVVISPNRATFPKASEQAPKPAIYCGVNTTQYWGAGIFFLTAFRRIHVPHPHLGIITEQAVSSEQHQLYSYNAGIDWFLNCCWPFQALLRPLSLIGYCSWDWSKFEINLVRYSGLSVSLRVGTMSLSNWGLISVESTDWMSVWAARIYSTAVSSLEHNSTKHLWCELPTWLLSSFL